MLALLCACSPLYAARSASGHAGLLWRRRSIARTIADPKTSPQLRRRLESVVAIRSFAFEKLALKRTRDYETWTPVKGSVLTWLVSASERLHLRSHQFRFPFVGSFPYKGYFRKDLALREAASLEERGYDATVSGAAAYNTPLPVSDPLPSSLLAYGEGDLAETLIHELAHGTIYFKDRTDFDEAVATWIGLRGAEAYLSDRFGSESAQMKEWLAGRAERDRRDGLFRELRDRLSALYDGPADPTEKMVKRQELFDWARQEAQARKVEVSSRPFNNAVVLAEALYAPDPAPFDAVFEKSGRDWPKTIAALQPLCHRGDRAVGAAHAPVHARRDRPLHPQK